MLLETPNEPKGQTPGQPSKGSRNRWHAVVIVPPASACAAVLACKGKRYLSSEAPRLPLADCNAPTCGCKYRHYQDRRAGPRRADEAGRDAKRPVSSRRTTKGRRALD